MNIILIDPAEIKNNRVTLRDRRSGHIRNILKSACGDTLIIGLINGPRGTGTIVNISGETVELETCLQDSFPNRPPTDLLLALPRPIMLKRIFSQAATFGVRRIFLINTARVEKSFFSASLLEEKSYRPLLLQGLEQAVDTMVPEVHIFKRFRPFVEDVLPTIFTDCPVRLVAHPGHFPFLPQSITLPLTERTVVAVGPEGGWVDFEIDKFRTAGFRIFTMGTRILRVDSVVPALLAQLSLLRQINRESAV